MCVWLVLITAPSSFCDAVRFLLQSCYRKDLFSSLALQSQNRVSHGAVVACYIRGAIRNNRVNPEVKEGVLPG